jgi:hypothetical protein
LGLRLYMVGLLHFFDKCVLIKEFINEQGGALSILVKFLWALSFDKRFLYSEISDEEFQGCHILQYELLVRRLIYLFLDFIDQFSLFDHEQLFIGHRLLAAVVEEHRPSFLLVAEQTFLVIVPKERGSVGRSIVLDHRLHLTTPPFEFLDFI